MAVNLPPPDNVLPVAGVRLASGAAGIRYQGRDDLSLISFAPDTRMAAVFTRNAFCAAPVTLARQHLAGENGIRAWLINAGNANAGTGEAGLDAARQTCAVAAEHLGCAVEAVLPFSTGVIGEALPVPSFAAAIPGLCAKLADDGWLAASRAMMTTDTVAKAFSRQLELPGGTVTITGMAKGSGMIRPDMATMLAFIATDARIEPVDLRRLLQGAVDQSFNRITIDGDTSTNDAVALAATGASAVAVSPNNADGQRFVAALNALCCDLAQACVRDGEGATRFITVQVDDARDEAEAREVAYTVAQSPLVKTAAFAGDPNWGRILAAVGRSGLPGLDVGRVSLFLDDVRLIAAGQPDPEYSEERGAAVAQQAEFTIRVELGRGTAGATIWTSDFSYDYVRINAEYRS